jgi:hypothetical protein
MVGDGLKSEWKLINDRCSVMMKGASLEASFPLSAIKKYVDSGYVYTVAVYSEYNGNGNFISVDGTGSKKLQF